MKVGGSVLGVMVCGVSEAHHERLKRQTVLLCQFGDLAARALLGWRARRDRERRIEADVAGHYIERARRVAHEVSNPLGIIKNYLRIVDAKLPLAHGVAEEVEILRQEVDRVARIVRQLGSDAMPSLAAPGPLDLNDVVGGLSLLYAASLFDASDRSLVLDLQRPLARTVADRDSVKQIVLNLWKSAAEASPPGARVVGSTADDIHHEGRTCTELRVRDGGDPRCARLSYRPGCRRCRPAIPQRRARRPPNRGRPTSPCDRLTLADSGRSLRPGS
jgi:signal transduction histidine kinase